jgi:Flp pilus assembly secretin CpaC
VDKNAFYSSLKQTEGVDARTAINSSVTASALARKFFNSLGVNMESPSGKAVFFRDDTDFFNDKSGTLFVKATTADLDLIEKAIQTINHIAPQIHIKARFLEVSEKTFQDFVVPHLFTNAADKSETNVLRGFLTDKQFVNMLRTLEKKSGFEIFAEPEAVTTSCRQLQMRATQIISIITNFTFHSTFQSTNFMSSKATRTNSTLVPQVSTVETGPILDVVPCVFADGYTINLAAIPSVTEFLGYDTTTNLNVLYNEAGEKVDVPKISPRIRVRQAVATANLWDGQTLVIGGLTSLPVLATTDKVPLSAQSQSKTNIEKAVLVFITATIVDPAGNRIHTDDELPFAKDGFPVQPPPPPQRGWKIFPR